MLLNPGQTFTGFKKAIFIFGLLFFFFAGKAYAQNPKDPSSPDVPELPKTQLPPAQLYDLLKDKNGDGQKKTGEDANKKLKLFIALARPTYDLKSIKNPTLRAQKAAQELETPLLEIIDKARKGDL
mgnify:CR=1 FL=1